ncbi:MAG: sigma 54-interacting transcriptional regulator [Myxococcales bacterium]|nr:sigma 54-interacting transcriptional regulator [Myxococcales bacterium]
MALPLAVTDPSSASAIDETRPARRLPLHLARTRRRVRVMVALALAYASGLFVAALTSPDRGFFTYQGSAVVVVDAGSPAAAAGLRVGDAIVAIDGVRVTDDVARARRLAAIGPDRAVTLTVRRGGELVDLAFTMPRRLPLASAGGVALALVLLALALLADRGRSHALPQQFLRSTVIYVVFLAGAFALDVIVHQPLLHVPWLYAMVLAAPATCHFMLRFPGGTHRFTRVERGLLYGPPLALATLLAVNHVAFWAGHPLPGRDALTLWGGGAAGALAAGYLSVGAVARARRLRARRAEIDPVAARWLHLAGGIMAAPLLIGTGVAIHDLEAFIAGGFGPYVAVAMVGGSACVVLAMTRVPFGELDRLWRRSSGYLLATLLAAGLYLVAIGLFGGAAATLSGGSFPAALGATLTAAVVFGPLRVRVQRLVDDRFARDRSRARRLLREAAEAAVATLDIDLLERGLVERTRVALAADGVGLFVADGAAGADGGWRCAVAAGEPGLGPGRPGWDETCHGLDAALTARAPRELPSGALAVPIPVGDRAPTVAVVSREARFDDEEVELLVTATAGFAIALGNARAHHALRELTQRLRREVDVAERRRREIARLKERLEVENQALVGELASRTGEAPVVGPGLAATFALAQKAARTDATVLVRGETGVGKELIARAIHAASPRRAGPFIVVDCGAIAAGLVESALFGHERGAFTGATRAAAGAFRAAHGGTIFLDELGELPLELQPKLLRVLQAREVLPVGAERPIAVDVRVVCGTNRDLAVEVAAGRFRDDLLYRLQVVEIAVPPLRARKTDLAALAEHFLARIARRTGRRPRRLAADALALLHAHDWPGNVRELEHALEAAAVYAEGEELTAQDLPVAGKVFRRRAERALDAAAVTVDGAPRAGLRQTLEDLERDRLAETLAAADGNRSRAARALGMSRGALLRRLKRYGLAGDEAAPGPGDATAAARSAASSTAVQ